MKDVHVTAELLRAVADGELPPQVLIEMVFDHLMALCPHCREELHRRQVMQEVESSRPQDVLQALPRVLERHAPDLEAKRKETERDFAELSALPHPERLARVRRAMRRFRGVLLAERLLDESKKTVPSNPALSRELAETAEAVLRHSKAVPGTADLYARAAALQGNAFRAQGDLTEAQSRFDLARSFVQRDGVTDPVLLAEIDSCEAVLALDLRHLDEAEKLLNRSIQLYKIAGERSRVAHPMLTLGRLHSLRGEHELAVQVTEAAAEAADPADRRFALYARHNLAHYLCEAGSFEAAAATVHETRHLRQDFADSFTQLRVAWVEGKIAVGLKRPEEGERIFLTVFEAFLARDLGYDAALVSIDLACLYAREERTADLKALSERMHPLLTAQAAHREAVASLKRQLSVCSKTCPPL